MADERTINSRIQGIRNQLPHQRLEAVANAAGLSLEDVNPLIGDNALPIDTADGMIENVVGKFELPIGVATNFTINGRDYLIPMVVEEPSVVAAASYMAKIVRDNGGFKTSSTAPIMRAQVQVLGLDSLENAKQAILSAKEEIINLANSKDHTLVALGGGCVDIEVHEFPDSPIGPMLVMHLLVDVRDAMGANTVNTMAETVAPLVEKHTGGTVRLRILSNLADRRLATAEICVDPESLSTDTLDGKEVAKGIVEAYALAAVDPYRAATHNKGIMNGIDPVIVATGNDWRAIEAGAYAWAARSGKYVSLTEWSIDTHGNLVGRLEMPMALGLVGGATRTHPAAQAALKLLNTNSANELSEVVVAVGLAQNMAALRALATEGIQRGHMALHARNLAISAGAKGENISRIANSMVEAGEITQDKAAELLNK